MPFRQLLLVVPFRQLLLVMPFHQLLLGVPFRQSLLVVPFRQLLLVVSGVARLLVLGGCRKKKLPTDLPTEKNYRRIAYTTPLPKGGGGPGTGVRGSGGPRARDAVFFFYA